MDFKDSQNIRIPILINLTNLTINNVTILNRNTIIHHDQPYSFNKNVYDGEIIEIKGKWEQLNSKQNINFIN